MGFIRSTFNFFTDGGYLYLCDYTRCIGSWAAVLDRSPCDEVTFNAADSYRYSGTSRHPTMTYVATGLSSGEQTASRGELIACTVCRRKVCYYASPW